MEGAQDVTFPMYVFLWEREREREREVKEMCALPEYEWIYASKRGSGWEERREMGHRWLCIII
jgi:hypothetical protein